MSINRSVAAIFAATTGVPSSLRDYEALERAQRERLRQQRQRQQ